MRHKTETLFKTEADLCTAFATAARASDWDKIYPEHCDYDLVLVDKDGTQVGVQAKLKANLHVLGQALSGTAGDWGPKMGPDRRAVVVGEDPGAEFIDIAHRLGLAVVYPYRHRADSWVGLEELRISQYWETSKPLWIPEIEVKMAGGSPSPKSVSKWKIAAVKLCLLLRQRGWLTSIDFKLAGIKQGRWLQMWLKAERDPKNVKKWIYTALDDPRYPLPDTKYPEIVEALATANVCGPEAPDVSR